MTVKLLAIKRKLDIQRKKDEEDYYAPDSQVAAALDQVAKHRTDIFGIEETGVGRKIGEERKIQSEIGWDGHAKTADQDCDKKRNSPATLAVGRFRIFITIKGNQTEAQGR